MASSGARALRGGRAARRESAGAPGRPPIRDRTAGQHDLLAKAASTSGPSPRRQRPPKRWDGNGPRKKSCLGGLAAPELLRAASSGDRQQPRRPPLLQLVLQDGRVALSGRPHRQPTAGIPERDRQRHLGGTLRHVMHPQALRQPLAPPREGVLPLGAVPSLPREELDPAGTLEASQPASHIGAAIAVMRVLPRLACTLP